MIYWVWLKNIHGIGPHTQRKLLEKFGGARDVFYASYGELLEAGFSERKAKAIDEAKDLSEAGNVITACERLGIGIINLSQEGFPERMRRNPDSPILLYYKGTLFEPGKTAGIVGPRKCTQETKGKVIDLTTRCILEGRAVISGMARGVDGYAHTAAIKNNGKTIAVVGNGLDICFPKEHETLYQAIQNAGCVISEYEPGVPALKQHFPRRNALIAALSDCLYIVDAGRNSGALITGQYAEKYGKNVYYP